MRAAGRMVRVGLVAVVVGSAAAWGVGLVAAARGPVPRRTNGLPTWRPVQRFVDTASPAAATSCAPVWTTVASPNASTLDNFLEAASVIAQNDVWAVGRFMATNRTFQTLAQHWDGTAWSVVPTGNVGNSDNALAGVSAISSNNVWGVGYYKDVPSGLFRTLVEHWDGTAWSVVSSPNAGSSSNFLAGVSAASASDVWAVGDWVGDGGVDQTLVEHWDGAAWSIVPSANAGSASSLLYGVTARTGDVWAVGAASSGTSGALQTLVEHTDGITWSVVLSPNVDPTQNDTLLRVATSSGGEAWAVGYSDSTMGLVPLVEHWTSGSWSIVPNPAGLPGDTRLFGLAAVSTGDVWVVGASGVDMKPVLAHWDGSSLVRIIGPSISKGVLAGTTTAAGTRVWATGQQQSGQNFQTLIERLCEISVLDAGIKPSRASIGQGATVAWNFSSTDRNAHTVSDASGMGLFDSGLKAAGASFTWTFTGAGSYTFIDQTNSVTGNIQIPVVATPPNGGVGTTFTVTWASASPPVGYDFDVQIKRPGSAIYVDWKTGQIGVSATFVPDAGTGVYSFRAHLENVSGASGWSPSASVTVS